MNYKPFDLEAAKAGAPVICRDGIPARFIAYVPEAHELYQVVFLRKGEIVSARKDGIYSAAQGCIEDLFMAPVKKTIHVNVYGSHFARGFLTRAEADEHAKANGGLPRMACVPLEYEEGQGL